MQQPPGSPTSALLRHSGGAVEDVVELLGDGERVFTVTSRPADQAATAPIGIVICPSVAHELVKNYRREALLARALAGKGFATAHLQYRGTGNSDGESAAMTYDSMREDALLVTEALMGSSPISQVAFLGSRFGVLVAASAATARGGAAVACLEPVMSVERYVKEGFRAKLVQGIGQGDARSRNDFEAELASVGSIDVFGVPLYRSFCDSWAGRTVAGELLVPAPVLLMQLGGQRPKTELTALCADLDERGFATSMGQAEFNESWWYQDEAELASIGLPNAADGTVLAAPEATASVVTEVLGWVESLAAAA